MPQTSWTSSSRFELPLILPRFHWRSTGSLRLSKNSSADENSAGDDGAMKSGEYVRKESRGIDPGSEEPGEPWHENSGGRKERRVNCMVDEWTLTYLYGASSRRVNTLRFCHEWGSTSILKNQPPHAIGSFVFRLSSVITNSLFVCTTFFPLGSGIVCSQNDEFKSDAWGKKM